MKTQLSRESTTLDLISIQAFADALYSKYDESELLPAKYAVDIAESLPAGRPVHNTTLTDVLTYFDSLKENEDAWTEFCACLECRGWDIVPAKRHNDEAREIFMAIVYDELYSDGDNNRANRIIDAADQYAEAGRPEPDWIPVERDLPKEKGEYLVTYHPCYWDNVEEITKVGIDSFRGKTTWAKKKYQKVIAWKPLPETYKQQAESTTANLTF